MTGHVNKNGDTRMMRNVPSPRLLAWAVTNDGGAGLLVWATTRGKAKSLAKHSAWFDGCDWTDILVNREPKADGLRDTPCAMSEEPTVEDQKLMRSLGWNEIEGSEETCLRCGLYEWHELPESRIGEKGICAGCHNGEATASPAPQPTEIA